MILPAHNAPYFPACATVRREAGLSLVELMVGLTLGLILMAAIVSLYVNTVRGSSDTLKMAKLNQDLRAAMSIMVADIRRAGYYSNAAADLDQGTNSNPFMQGGNEVNTATAGCILYSYDSQSDGSADANDLFGFRLNNNVIQMRSGGAGPLSCTGAGNTWEDISSSNSTVISALSFTPTDVVLDVDGILGPSTLTKKDILISITGNLAGDAAVARTLTETIRIRNDVFTP